MGATATEQDTTAADKAAADKAKQAEREAKAKAREEAKAAKAKEQAEARAAKELEAINKILADLPDDRVDALRKQHGDGLTRQHARDAVKAFKAEERANRPKKAPLTLSQRRALLNLGDAKAKGVVPKTPFNALPLQHLVDVGLAEPFETKGEQVVKETVEKEVPIPEADQKEGGPTTKTVKEKVEKTVKVDATGFRLTEAGKARVKEINPKWQTWKPAASADSDDAVTAEPATA